MDANLMAPDLIERLQLHRAQLKAAVALPGFARIPQCNRILTELLALDRLLATMERGTTEAPREEK